MMKTYTYPLWTYTKEFCCSAQFTTMYTHNNNNNGNKQICKVNRNAKTVRHRLQSIFVNWKFDLFAIDNNFGQSRDLTTTANYSGRTPQCHIYTHTSCISDTKIDKVSITISVSCFVHWSLTNYFLKTFHGMFSILQKRLIKWKGFYVSFKRFMHIIII